MRSALLTRHQYEWCREVICIGKLPIVLFDYGLILIISLASFLTTKESPTFKVELYISLDAPSTEYCKVMVCRAEKGKK